MKSTLSLIGSIVFGWIAVLGFLCGSSILPAPWYQWGTVLSLFVSIILFNRFKNGRVR